MKIHLYGNTLNNSYNLTCFLRKKGFEAVMFLDDSSALQQDYPWWEDTNLSPTNLPPWIYYYPVNPNWRFPQREVKEMISSFSKCDIALVCGWGPIVASRAGVPYLFHSFGADLNITSYSETLINALRTLIKFRKPVGLKSLLLKAPLQRRAIKKANRIGIYMGYQINPYVRKLGIIHKMKKMRLAWDVERYKTPEDQTLKAKYEPYEIVYFMLARHEWKSVWGDIKGNDKFIRAYARFLKDRNPNVVLVTIDKGGDVGASKKLIYELGIDNKVEWVSEMNKDGIRAYISLENVVVVDQFWHDRWYLRYPDDKARPRLGFGSASIEALSAGKPLITVFFDEEFYDNQHPPILSAFTEDQIYNRLVESWELGPEGRKKLGQEGYRFVKKHHGWENAVERHVEVLREILAEKNGSCASQNVT
jgi:glycosyltransferase involved in cell wall biosynthesis